MSKYTTCGRCGVYRHLHPTTRCARPRRSFWWNRHSPIRHASGLLWLRLPEKARWRVVTVVNKVRPDLCWCDLVDAALLDNHKDDYRDPWGCACDVALPTDARPPVPGRCYCPVPEAIP